MSDSLTLLGELDAWKTFLGYTYPSCYDAILISQKYAEPKNLPLKLNLKEKRLIFFLCQFPHCVLFFLLLKVLEHMIGWASFTVKHTPDT